MSQDIKKAVDGALDRAGLRDERVVIGTYDAGRSGRIGVYFHCKFTERLANALILLALEDSTVYEGLRDLRRQFDLLLSAIDGTRPVRKEEPIH
jgi:hypothetical protein